MLVIVTVVLNGITTIERCIRSVQLQQDKSFKYLIFDGGSTDGTVELVKTYIEYGNKITLIEQKDNGIYDAMNNALKYVNAGKILFLNSDDELFDSGVTQRINAISAPFSIVAPVYWDNTKSYLVYDQEKSWTYMQPGTVYFLDWSVRTMRFDTRYSIAADLDYAYQYLSKENCVFHDEPFIRMYSGGASSGARSKIEAIIVHVKYGNLRASSIAFLKLIYQFLK